MTEINRRGLIGVAGASFALAACSKNNASSGKKAKQIWQDADKIEWKGIFPNYGHPVSAAKPDPLQAGVTFDPKWICVVYLKMEGNGEFTARHGYEPYPGTYPNPQDERRVVDGLLQAAARGPASWMHSSGEKEKRREHNFDDFSQNSQQRIWLFVDNLPREMSFEDRNGKDYVVRFAPMSGVDPENQLPMNLNRQHYPNNAFFNIDIITNVFIPGLKGQTLISLDYWNTDHEGKPVTVDPNAPVADHYLYAINIHLKLAMSKRAGPNQWLPMIIDPDGGNMGSQP
jgi:hypothetical protein